MIRLPAITGALAALAAICARADDTRTEPPPTKLLQIRTVAVDGKAVSWQDGKTLRTRSSPHVIWMSFGPSPNGEWNPIRLRYKLEGWDRDWQWGGSSFMYLAVRFCNESGDVIRQDSFEVRGDSAGWTGSLANSRLIHRRETVRVPPQASRAWIVISSAGPPAAVGVYIIDNLLVFQSSPDDLQSELLLSSALDQRGQKPTSVLIEGEREDDWQRDGTRPSMAKVFEIGPDPKVKALGILDEDPAGHAEWHTRRETAPRVTAGDRLILEWNELYSIGEAGLHQVGPAYENLPPGDYQFRVSEVTAMGVPTGIEALLALRVPRAPWRTEWFWTAVAALGLGSVAGGSRYYTAYKMRRVVARLKHHQLMQAERLRIAQDIHDDLGARATQISLFSAMAQTKGDLPEDTRTDFEQISFMSRELVSALYETVWAVDPENDNLEALGDFLCQIAGELCETVRLRCRFEIEELPRDVELSSQTRHHIIMAVKEAVHNIVKHAEASETVIRAEYVKPELRVSVNDNGRGFDHAGAGNGLSNMRRRLEEIGGECIVESTQGRGTIVRLRLIVRPPDPKAMH